MSRVKNGSKCQYIVPFAENFDIEYQLITVRKEWIASPVIQTQKPVTA